ncbi:MAG: 2-C-methyl-D-erythritol 4-phosphate cytidylyltransferase [Bacteroidia bacterium]|nr:2-C-methyl-D-erythritol 4-phosphate cytidylyltransferase [Bacteroidia bacterium]
MARDLRPVWVQLAGGSGVRFGGTLPKQFRRLGRKPVLVYAVETFLELYPEGIVIVVLPLAHFRYGERLLRKAFPHAALYLTVGGPTRSGSTEAALTLLEDLELLSQEYVMAFHDAVRPFVSKEVIKRAIEAGAESGAAVCGIPVSFSVRLVEGEASHAIPRNRVWEVQTPQVFRGDILREAWRRLSPLSDESFTDEGSWVEAAGFTVRLVAGEPQNLKLTYPMDWEVARSWLKRQKTSS